MDSKEVKNMDLHAYITRFHPSNFIKILYHDRTLVIKLLKREERIKELEDRLNRRSLLFTDRKNFIKFLFKCVKDCDYVIFFCSKEDQFCQFGLRGGTLFMDFPVTRYNDHLKHLKETRKLLESLNFSFTEGKLVYMKYKYNDEDDMPTLNADFGVNVDLASEFVKRVFEDIYKDSLSKLKITIG